MLSLFSNTIILFIKTRFGLQKGIFLEKEGSSYIRVNTAYAQDQDI